MFSKFSSSLYARVHCTVYTVVYVQGHKRNNWLSVPCFKTPIGQMPHESLSHESKFFDLVVFCSVADPDPWKPYHFPGSNSNH